MKKLMLLGLTLCFVVGAYHNTQAQSVDLGVKVGANFSNINDAKHMSNKTGLVAGAFVALGFNNWAIQPEVLYSQQGAKTDIGDFDLDYVNIPVMFKYYIVGNFLNLQVGPQFGFLTHDSFKDQVDNKSFDFSGAAGAGLDLPFGLRVDARYNFGLTDISKDASGKNGVFSIALGYSFL